VCRAPAGRGVTQQGLFREASKVRDAGGLIGTPDDEGLKPNAQQALVGADTEPCRDIGSEMSNTNSMVPSARTASAEWSRLARMKSGAVTPRPRCRGRLTDIGHSTGGARRAEGAKLEGDDAGKSSLEID